MRTSTYETRTGVPAAVAALVATLAMLAASLAAPGAASDRVNVIVRGLPGAAEAVERAVTAVGGAVTRPLSIIDGVVAEVPASELQRLGTSAGVRSVTPDQRIEVLGKPGGKTDSGGGGGGGGGDSCAQLSKCVPAGQSAGHVKTVAYTTGAAESWDRGYTGKGIDIALIDTGVTNVPGLNAPGKVIDGPDLSFDGQDATWRHRDGFGHGTHLAGIIAGRDASIASGQESSATASDAFIGIAPDARIVDVKVGDRNGVVDVSQVIAGIDWVVQHRNANGMNIRVLNLAFGTNATQSYLLDPLTYAAEVAWRNGIVVVASAGNSGHLTGQLVNPAHDPHILAVGASDPNGTVEVSDDVVPSWSTRGDGTRNPDIVAPGRSIESLVAPGSVADLQHSSAKTSDRLMKGSGTSQSAAVVSGAVALYLEANPSATPDQVKKAFKDNAANLPAADSQAQGSGSLRVRYAISDRMPSARQSAQSYPYASGTGLLELSRGDSHVSSALGVPLIGEVSVTGSTWSGSTWSGSTWSGSTWSGSTWSTGQWLGSTWSGSTWSGSTWSGSTWSGSTWSGSTWSGSTWSSTGWLGVRWE